MSRTPDTSRRWFVVMQHPNDVEVARLRLFNSKSLSFSCGAFDPLDDSVEACFCFKYPQRISYVQRILPTGNWHYKPLKLVNYQNALANKPGYWVQGDSPKEGLRYGCKPAETYRTPWLSWDQIEVRAVHEVEYWKSVLDRIGVLRTREDFHGGTHADTVAINESVDIGKRNITIDDENYDSHEDVNNSLEDSTNLS